MSLILYFIALLSYPFGQDVVVVKHHAAAPSGITYIAGACSGNPTNSNHQNDITGLNTTGANFLVIGATTNPAAYGQTPAIVVSDSTSVNTWTPLTQVVYPTSSAVVQLFYAQNATGSSSQNFRMLDSMSTPSYPTFCVMAFSGVKTSGALDAGTDLQSYTSIAQATIQTASVTPGTGKQLVITTAGNDCCRAIYATSIDSSFLPATPIYAGGIGLFSNSLSYLIQASGATVHPTWTFLNATGYLASSIAAFAGK